MNNDIKRKFAKCKNLGWGDSKIRRNLLLRKSIYNYLEIVAKNYPEGCSKYSHRDLVKEARAMDRIRPTPNVLIDQCPVYPEDLARRVELILENEYPISDKRILFVGDDDLASCLLLTACRPKLLGLIDVDDRILKLLTKTAEKRRVSNKTLARKGDIVAIVSRRDKDPFGGIVFDAFVTDPPYTETGYDQFLSYGIMHLGFDGRAYIAVPYMNMEDWTDELLFKVEKLLIVNGLAVEKLIPGFALYQRDDGVVSSIIIAKKVSNPLLAGKTTVPSLSKMYTTRFPAEKLERLLMKDS